MRRAHQLTRLLTIVAALVLVAAACGDDEPDDEAADVADVAEDDGDGDTTTSAPPDTVAGIINAADQMSDGQAVEVDEVTIEGAPGWVVIHADEGGSPGAVVGSAPIPDGTSTDVEVATDEPIESGTYHVMLHRDAGTEDRFEFPGPDAPVMEDDEVVVTPIEVTVSGSSS